MDLLLEICDFLTFRKKKFVLSSGVTGILFKRCTYDVCYKYCKSLPPQSESKVTIVFQYVIKMLTASATWSASKNMNLSARTNQ